MKTRIQCARVLAAAVLCGGALWYTYDLAYSRGRSCGYSQGSRDERATWIVLPTTSESLVRGDFLARRASGKSLLAGELNLRPASAVNNMPEAFPRPKR
jgi:hypothetical protein